MCQSQQVLELFPCTRAAPADKAIEEMRGGDTDVGQDDGDGSEIRLGRSTVCKDCFYVSEMECGEGEPSPPEERNLLPVSWPSSEKAVRLAD